MPFAVPMAIVRILLLLPDALRKHPEERVPDQRGRKKPTYSSIGDWLPPRRTRRLRRTNAFYLWKTTDNIGYLKDTCMLCDRDEYLFTLSIQVTSFRITSASCGEGKRLPASRFAIWFWRRRPGGDGVFWLYFVQGNFSEAGRFYILGGSETLRPVRGQTKWS